MIWAISIDRPIIMTGWRCESYREQAEWLLDAAIPPSTPCPLCPLMDDNLDAICIGEWFIRSDTALRLGDINTPSTSRLIPVLCERMRGRLTLLRALTCCRHHCGSVIIQDNYCQCRLFRLPRHKLIYFVASHCTVAWADLIRAMDLLLSKGAVRSTMTLEAQPRWSYFISIFCPSSDILLPFYAESFLVCQFLSYLRWKWPQLCSSIDTVCRIQ